MVGFKLSRFIQVLSVLVLVGIISFCFFIKSGTSKSEVRPLPLQAFEDDSNSESRNFDNDTKTEVNEGAIAIQTLGDGAQNREDQLVKTDILTKERDRSNNARVVDIALLGQQAKTISKERNVRNTFQKRPMGKSVIPHRYRCAPYSTKIKLKTYSNYSDFPPFLYSSTLDTRECAFVKHALDSTTKIFKSEIFDQHCVEENELQYLHDFFKQLDKRKNTICDDHHQEKATQKVWLFVANRILECKLLSVGESLNEKDLAKAADLINLGVTVSLQTQADGRQWFNSRYPKTVVESFHRTNVMQWVYRIIRSKLEIPSDHDAIIHLVQNYSQICLREEPICNCPQEMDYSFDGTCNSNIISKSIVGKSISAFNRIGRPFCVLDFNYGYHLPSAREASLMLAYINNVLERRQICQKISENEMSVFGLFQIGFIFSDIAHSIHKGIGVINHEGLNGCSNDGTSLHEDLRHDWTRPIQISSKDPVYGLHGRTCMNFISSQRLNEKCELSETNLVNLATSYLDLSQLYGHEEGNTCNIFGKSGKILIGRDGLLRIADQRAYTSAPSILTWQIWAMIHNTIADMVVARIGGKTDLFYFKMTRRILIYIYQRFIYFHALPLILGREFAYRQHISSDAKSFDRTINPTTVVEFSCAAASILHRYLPDKIQLIHHPITDSPPEVVGNQYLKNGYGGYEIFMRNKSQELFNGLTSTPVFKTFRGFQVHNEVFKDEFKLGIDLIALDIQKSRDCCLRSYTYYIEILDSRTIQSWNDFIKFDYFTKQTVSSLKILYQHHNLVDLYVGMALEKKNGTDLGGRTWRRIVTEVFLHLKLGDYKHFSNALNQRQKSALSKVNIQLLIAMGMGRDEYAEKPLLFKQKNVLITKQKDAGLLTFIDTLLGD